MYIEAIIRQIWLQYMYKRVYYNKILIKKGYCLEIGFEGSIHLTPNGPNWIVSSVLAYLGESSINIVLRLLVLLDALDCPCDFI